eukprot:UN03386
MAGMRSKAQESQKDEIDYDSDFGEYKPLDNSPKAKGPSLLAGANSTAANPFAPSGAPGSSSSSAHGGVAADADKDNFDNNDFYMNVDTTLQVTEDTLTTLDDGRKIYPYTLSINDPSNRGETLRI